MIKSVLLNPLLVLNVVKWLSSFIICIFAHYYSSVHPLLLSNSCHEVDLELLSIAISKPASFACCIIASNFIRSISICRLMSKYMLVMLIFCSPLLSPKLQHHHPLVVLLTSCLICFFTTIAARCFPSDVKIFIFLDKPSILPRIVYGSWMKRMSVFSSSVIFNRLSVASLECWRFSCLHLRCVCIILFTLCRLVVGRWLLVI